MEDPALAMSALRRLYELIARINCGRSLPETLQAVADGVVEGVGFGVAVVNHRIADGSFETVAVAGSEDAKAALLGTRRSRDAFDREFTLADSWGALRFVPHERLPEEERLGWVPDVPILDVPDAWHPLDALFAPLSAPSGETVGMLSVDLPADGRRPAALQRELLEMYAVQAGIAIDNARLTERLHREQERLREEQLRLSASEQAFRLAFEGAGVGMSLIDLAPDRAGRFLRVNERLAEITGYPVEQLVGMHVADLTHPEDRVPDLAALDRGMTGQQKTYRAEKRYLTPTGRTVWVSVTTSMIQAVTGGYPFAISQVEDITDRRAADDELARRAAQDPLTGLPNRTALRERLLDSLERVGRTGRTGAVLFCDLDGFKDVNDIHGHAAGDAMLAAVAARLGGQLRAGDFVARLGGDEFVVLAEDITQREVAVLAERIERAIAQPVVGGDMRLQVTVSIGIAAVREPGRGVPETPEELIAAADAAMYRAKTAGRNRHAFTGW